MQLLSLIAALKWQVVTERSFIAEKGDRQPECSDSKIIAIISENQALFKFSAAG